MNIPPFACQFGRAQQQFYFMSNEKTTIAQLVDHTLLRADANLTEIEAHCRVALECGFFSVCVNPIWVQPCAQILRNSTVVVCTVVGFPLGANTSASKAQMAREAIELGAKEIDMVINLGALKSGQWGAVEKDISEVVKSSGKNVVKVILETTLLTEAEKIQACKVSEVAGAAFVKTSTGFGPGGATVADVALMKKTVGNRLKVKASGGIRDLATLQKMVEAGASRIGSSAGRALLGGTADTKGTY